MIWLIFGAPGSGKGTQSNNIVAEYGFNHLSTGDMFRSHIKEGSELGRKAQEYMKDGNLVPDEIVIKMVGESLSKDKPTILDGFPRTLPQGEGLSKLLDEKNLPLSGVINLEVPQESLMKRLTGRRVCKSCGAVYHVDFKPSEVEGKCDVCSGVLVHRNDDKAEVIENRLSVFNKQTEPLLKFYEDRGLLYKIDGVGDSSEVFSRIEKILLKK